MRTQVTVKRGDHEDVWWIESRLAVAGKRLRDEAGRVWTVAEVHGERDSYFLEGQQNARGQLAYVLGESDHNPRRDAFSWQTQLDGVGIMWD